MGVARCWRGTAAAQLFLVALVPSSAGAGHVSGRHDVAPAAADQGRTMLEAAPHGQTRRRLAQIHLSPGADLQAAVNNASPGDELVLADGTYSAGSGTSAYDDHNMLYIDKDITIRAQNAGKSILDGENSRGVIFIRHGVVTLKGLGITKGYVRACSQDAAGAYFSARPPA